MMERRTIQDRAFVAQRGVQNVLRQMAPHDDRRRAFQEIEHDRNRKMVSHREDPDNPVVWRDPQPPVAGFDPRHERRMGKHDAFRAAGRAGAEPDKCRGQSRDGRLLEPQFLRGALRFQKKGGRQFRDFFCALLATWPEHSSSQHHGMHPDRPDQRLAFGRCQFARHRHQASARAQNRQRKNDVVRAVGACQSHAGDKSRPGLRQTRFQKRARRAVNLGFQLSVGERQVVANQGYGLPVASGKKRIDNIHVKISRGFALARILSRFARHCNPQAGANHLLPGAGWRYKGK